MQKLSPTARRDKAARDLAFAKSPVRRAKKAENQRLRRAAIKSGKDIDGKDYDHSTDSFVSEKENRGGFGKGTK
mgnify:CR=1 FL=1|tara:strand:+ start:725 stop:946 length:222 start_codon:yes stop_codon:yes gene_type:complete